MAGSGKGRYGDFCSYRNRGGAVDIVARLTFVLLSALAYLACEDAAAFGKVPTEQNRLYTSTMGGKTATGVNVGGVSVCDAVLSMQDKVTTGGVNQSITHNYVRTSSPTDPIQGNCSYRDSWTCTDPRNGSSCGSGTTSAGVNYTSSLQITCPANSTDVNSPATPAACQCNFGFSPNSAGTSCSQYTCPPSGGYSAITQPDQKVTNAGDILCSAGCGYQPSSWKVGEDGQIWATWPFKSTGKFCGGAKLPLDPKIDSGELNSKNPAPVACGTNQCPGQVNGVTICVPCRGQQEQGPSTSASSPTGSASAPAGTTSTTECNGVSCTTTTTTRDGSGAVTGTAQTEQKQESFCKENPQSSLCKQSSFGGTCGATTCEGDAVACAIAADQYRRNCQWFDDSDAAALKEVGTANMSGQVQPDGHPAKSADSVVVALSSSIDQSDALGGGNCPSDVSFSVDVPLVGARSVTIGFGQMCNALQIAGQAGVAIALLWAGLFVFRGVS